MSKYEVRIFEEVNVIVVSANHQRDAIEEALAIFGAKEGEAYKAEARRLRKGECTCPEVA